MKRVFAVVLCLAGARAQAGSRATACIDHSGDAFEWERRCFGGLWNGLDAQGRAGRLETEAGVVFNPSGVRGDPVEYMKTSARVLILPRPFHPSLTSLWAIALGARISNYFLHARLKPDGTLGEFNSANVGNFEVPSFGLLMHTLFDRFRFEVDVAPVFGLGRASRLEGEAALLSALASGPDDDFMFLPNLRTAARIRGFVRLRFDPHSHFSVALSVRATAGYAEVAATSDVVVGSATPRPAPAVLTGTIGGAEGALELLFPTGHHAVSGGLARFALNLGYSSVWPADVVLPVRSSFELGVSFGRTVELTFMGSVFSHSAPLAGLIEFGSLGLNVRYSPAAGPEMVRDSVTMAREDEPTAQPALKSFSVP